MPTASLRYPPLTYLLVLRAFISLGHKNYFKLIRGKRVKKKDIYGYPGNIPVISSSHEVDGYLGFASEEWLTKNESPVFEKQLITVNMDGSIGSVFLRNESKYTINDVVTAIEVTNEKLDPLYIVYAIKEAIARERFTYGAKLYTKRLKKLKLRVPIDDKGEIDIEQQKILARKYEWLEELKRTMERFAVELENKFITAD